MQQSRQSYRLSIASFKELLAFFSRQVRIRDNGFHISLDAAYRSFQFMSDDLRQLSYQASLFLLLSNVVDGNFDGVVLKNDTFELERFPVFVDVRR